MAQRMTMSGAISGWCRAALLLIAVGLAGCAARVEPPSVPAPGAPTPPVAWTAAIGRLDVQGASFCTAVLIKPTLILTASHCLHQKPDAAAPASLTFQPNFGAEPSLPPSQGIRLYAQGGVVREGHLARPEQIMADWALVEISPVTAVAPLPLTPIDTQEVVRRLQGGAKLFTAGYGQGSEKRLKQHTACGIVHDEKVISFYRDRMLVTDCIIRIGDSGGPVILLDRAGKPSVLGIFAGFDTQRGLSYAVSAGTIVSRIGNVPVSGVSAEVAPLAILLPDQALILAVATSSAATQHGRY